MLSCGQLKQDWGTIFNWLTHIITTRRIKYATIWIVRYNYKTYLNKKIDPVVCLSGFWTKLSRRLSFPRWPRSKIPYLFSLNCRKEVSSPSSKFLSRSSAVNKDHLPKVLHKASQFTKTISKTDCSHLLLPLKVEYEIANNGMQAHWILAVLPKTTFPWWMTCELPYTVLLLLALFHFIRNNGEMITTNSEGFLTS